MTRGTLAARLAALPLVTILCAATGAHTAPARATDGPPADCATFAAVWYGQITPLGHTVIPGERAVSILTDLANATPGSDPASAAVRTDAQAIVADLERYDGPAAERDASGLTSDAGKLLAQCGSAAHSKTA
jgi:hypothetical protein